MNNGTLTAFWITFPKDPEFPMGLGVTGWSRADVYRLLEENARVKEMPEWCHHRRGELKGTVVVMPDPLEPSSPSCRWRRSVRLRNGNRANMVLPRTIVLPRFARADARRRTPGR